MCLLEPASQFHMEIRLSGPIGDTSVVAIADYSYLQCRPAQENQQEIVLHIFSSEEDSDSDIKVCLYSLSLYELFAIVCHG